MCRIKAVRINYAPNKDFFPDTGFRRVLEGGGGRGGGEGVIPSMRLHVILSFPARVPGPFSGRSKRESRNRTRQFSE